MWRKNKNIIRGFPQNDDYIETDDCQAGCKFFTGAEVRHHPDCVHYHESFSKLYDMRKAAMDEIKELLIIPSVDEYPEIAINNMKILNILNNFK